MRALAVAMVLLVTSAAEAKRVVRLPTLRELCPGGDDWSQITSCFTRHGKHTILRDDATAKIVSFATGSRIAGIYFYVEQAKRWQLRGELRMYNEHELVGFSRVSFGKHAAYRMDVGMSVQTSLSLDGETSRFATLRLKRTVLCFDKHGACFTMTTACDVLVRGRAYHSFRGTLVTENGMLKVKGDRRAAGPSCQQHEDVYQLDQ